MSLLIKNGHVIDPEIKLDMVRDVLIQDDRIVRVDENISDAADEVIDANGMYVMPGFIDSHIHYPQAEIIGMYGKQLLDWLDDYTFPAEQGFALSEHADRMARSFRRAVPERNDGLHGLCNGTSGICHRPLLCCVGI